MGTAYGDALPLTGTINLKQVREFKDSRPYVITDIISLCTTNINPYELANRKPNGNPPYDLLSFRGYRHKAINAPDPPSINSDLTTINISINTSGISLSAITVSKNVSWLNLSYNSTNGVLTVICYENLLELPRSGDITVSAQDISLVIRIYQAGSGLTPPPGK